MYSITEHSRATRFSTAANVVVCVREPLSKALDWLASSRQFGKSLAIISTVRISGIWRRVVNCVWIM